MQRNKRILYLGLDPARFSRDGAQLTHYPIIQIVPRPLQDPFIFELLKEFHRFSHLVITSKNCASLLFDYLEQLGFRKDDWMNKTTLAVGKASASYLQRRGIGQLVVAKEETADGVIQMLKELALGNAHIFWPHSAQARPVIRDFLAAQNITHSTCALYDVQTHFPTSSLPCLDDFDEIVFTSPSTVKAFLEVFGSFPAHAVLTAIGPVTEQSLLLNR